LLAKRGKGDWEMRVTKHCHHLPALVFLFETQAVVVLDLGSIDWALHKMS
jgi:hypothetical protein